jgi:hypothetical protein
MVDIHPDLTSPRPGDHQWNGLPGSFNSYRRAQALETEKFHKRAKGTPLLLRWQGRPLTVKEVTKKR